MVEKIDVEMVKSAIDKGLAGMYGRNPWRFECPYCGCKFYEPAERYKGFKIVICMECGNAYIYEPV